MSEFKKRAAENAPDPETTAPDAFTDGDWNEADFEQMINMSLSKKLKNTTDPQWNEMLETFNNESFEDAEQAENAAIDTAPDDTAQKEAVPVFPKANDAGDDPDDNIFSDDFDDDFDKTPEEKASGNTNDDGFSDDFDDDSDDDSDDDGFDDDFDDDIFSDDFDGEKRPASSGLNNASPVNAEEEDGKSPFNLVLRLLILLAAVLTGLVILINMSIKNAMKDSDGWTAESTASENAAAPVRSDTPAEVSSQADASSQETTSADDKASSKDNTSSEESAPTHNYKELKKGDNNENVLKMQNRLCELGFLSENSCTGYYGEYTVKKVMLFQKAAGLEQTGKADPTTLERLYAKDAPKA